MYEEVRGKRVVHSTTVDSHKQWNFLQPDRGAVDAQGYRGIAPASFDRNAGELSQHQQQRPSTAAPTVIIPEEARFRRRRNDVTSNGGGGGGGGGNAAHGQVLREDPAAFHYRRLSQFDESASTFLGLSHKYRTSHVDRRRAMVPESDRVGHYYTPESCFAPKQHHQHQQQGRAPAGTIRRTLSDSLVPSRARPATSNRVPSVPRLDLSDASGSPRVLRHSLSAREGSLANVLNQAESLLGAANGDVLPEDLLLSARSLSTGRLRDLISRAAATNSSKPGKNSKRRSRWGGLRKWMVEGAASDSARLGMGSRQLESKDGAGGAPMELARTSSAALLQNMITPRRRSLWTGAIESARQQRDAADREEKEQQQQQQEEEERRKRDEEKQQQSHKQPGTPQNRRPLLGKPPLSPSMRRPSTAAGSERVDSPLAQFASSKLSPDASSAEKDLMQRLHSELPGPQYLEPFPTSITQQHHPALSPVRSLHSIAPASPRPQSQTPLSSGNGDGSAPTSPGGRKSRPSIRIDTSSGSGEATPGVNGTPEQKKAKTTVSSGYATPASGVPRKRTNPRRTMMRVVSPQQQGKAPGPPPPPPPSASAPSGAHPPSP